MIYNLWTDPAIYNERMDVANWHISIQKAVRAMNNNWYRRQSGAKQ